MVKTGFQFLPDHGQSLAQFDDLVPIGVVDDGAALEGVVAHHGPQEAVVPQLLGSRRFEYRFDSLRGLQIMAGLRYCRGPRTAVSVGIPASSRTVVVVVEENAERAEGHLTGDAEVRTREVVMTATQSLDAAAALAADREDRMLAKERRLVVDRATLVAEVEGAFLAEELCLYRLLVAGSSFVDAAVAG